MLMNHFIEAHSLDEITKVIFKKKDAKQEIVDRTLEDEEPRKELIESIIGAHSIRDITGVVIGHDDAIQELIDRIAKDGIDASVIQLLLLGETIRKQVVDQLAEGGSHDTIQGEVVDDDTARGELLDELIEYDINTVISSVLEDDTARHEILEHLVEKKIATSEITDAFLLDPVVSTELVEKLVDDNNCGSLTRQILMNDSGRSELLDMLYQRYADGYDCCKVKRLMEESGLTDDWEARRRTITDAATIANRRAEDQLAELMGKNGREALLQTNANPRARELAPSLAQVPGFKEEFKKQIKDDLMEGLRNEVTKEKRKQLSASKLNLQGSLTNPIALDLVEAERIQSWMTANQRGSVKLLKTGGSVSPVKKTLTLPPPRR
jgi:hypothetical protein